MQTPWGQSESIEKIGNDGIIFVSTERHGGFHVPQPLIDRIPAAHRAATFRQLGEQGWFEEDCDWCIVVKAFPELFGERQQQIAEKTFSGAIMRKLDGHKLLHQFE